MFAASALSKVTLHRFVKCNVFIGHTIKEGSRDAFCYLLGIRGKIFIINLEHTVEQFRSALLFICSISIYNKANVCFVALNRFFANYVKYSALRCKQSFFVMRWVNGFFSNFKQLIWNPKRYKKRTNVRRLPQVIICLNIDRKTFFAWECRRARLALVGFVDSNIDPAAIIYPIVGNDDSVLSLRLYCDLFSSALKKAVKREVLWLRADCWNHLNLFYQQFIQRLWGIIWIIESIFRGGTYYRRVRFRGKKLRHYLRLSKLFSLFFYKYYDSFNDPFFYKQGRLWYKTVFMYQFHSRFRAWVYKRKSHFRRRKAFVFRRILRLVRYSLWFNRLLTGWSARKNLFRLIGRVEGSKRHKVRNEKFFRRYFWLRRKFKDYVWGKCRKLLHSFKKVKIAKIRTFYSKLLKRWYRRRFQLWRGFWFFKRSMGNRFRLKSRFRARLRKVKYIKYRYRLRNTSLIYLSAWRLKAKYRKKNLYRRIKLVKMRRYLMPYLRQIYFSRRKKFKIKATWQS